MAHPSHYFIVKHLSQASKKAHQRTFHTIVQNLPLLA